MELAKISVILIGMDIHMILGEAWNVTFQVIACLCNIHYIASPLRKTISGQLWQLLGITLHASPRGM